MTALLIVQGLFNIENSLHDSWRGLDFKARSPPRHPCGRSIMLIVHAAGLIRPHTGPRHASTGLLPA
jgi:hypothetical protein